MGVATCETSAMYKPVEEFARYAVVPSIAIERAEELSVFKLPLRLGFVFDVMSIMANPPVPSARYAKFPLMAIS